MDRAGPGWASPLFAAFRAGALGPDELWTLVLSCHDHADAAGLARRVLASYGVALREGPEPDPDLVVVVDESAA